MCFAFLLFSLSKGVPSAFLPIFHFAFIDYSRHVAEKINALNIDLYGKADLRFIECMYKVYLTAQLIFLYLLSPVKRGYCFRFVYLSVCPGRFFFSFCARNSSYSFHHTQTKLYHLKAGCLECVMGGQFFRTPQISAK